MNDLLAEIERAIVEEEQIRSRLMFDLGQCAGRIEMAKSLLIKLMAVAAQPPNEVGKKVGKAGDDDAG